MLRHRRLKEVVWPCCTALCAVWLVGCDADEAETEKREDLAAFANTALRGDTQRELEEADAKAAREAAAAEVAAKKAEAEAEHNAKIQGLATLPEKMPRNLEKACDAVLESYEEFVVKKKYPEDAKNLMNFYDSKSATLGERRAKCVKVGSVEAAACQANALMAADPELKDYELEIMSACVQKFAPEVYAKIAAEEAKALGEG